MPNQPSPARSKREIVVSVFLWISIPLMVVMPLWLFFSSLAEAQRQHRIVSTYVPVRATVLSAQVTHYADSDHEVHYHAEIKYQYTVDGKTYQSYRLLPVYHSGNEGWAEAMVARFQPGKSCDAFHDPQNPDRAVLIRQYRFDPYADMLGLALVATTGLLMVLYLWFQKRPEPTLSANGWFAILPGFGERPRLVIARVCTCAWYGLGAIAAAHYFLCVPPPHSGGRMIFELYALGGLVPLGMMVRYLWMTRNLDEAELLVNQPAAFLGRPFRFAVSQNARRQLQVKDARAQLVCIGSKSQGQSRTRRTLFEATPVELKDQTLHAGESLDLRGELVLPSDRPPTGRDATGAFDRIYWELRLNCKAVHAPDYTATFPINVQTPPPEEPEPAGKPGVFADVRPVEPAFAGRILAKRNVAVAYLFSMIPPAVLLAGMAMLVSGFLALFPNKSGDKPFLNLSKPRAERLFVAGAVLGFVSAALGLGFPNLLGGGYVYALTRRSIKRRRDAIVRPDDADSVLVDVIPRRNWNRMMLVNVSDTGFLVVDAGRREIRFEGDRERYRIPADALVSCNLEKSTLVADAPLNAPGFWLAVIRAHGPEGVWEAPVLPCSCTTRITSKKRRRMVEALQAKIKALLPAERVVGSQ